MYKKISIILPIRNEKKYISRCLNSIFSQDYPKEKTEIIIIEGMSDDGTREILKEYLSKNTNLKIIDNPDKIVPIALNIGIKYAKGDIIIRMDAHATYEKDYISKCVEYLDCTITDNVGGVVKHIGEGFTGNAIALTQAFPFGLGGAKFRTAIKEQYVDTIFPGCWYKKAFEKYGYFNEQLIRNQDIEHNARIRKGGGRIYLTPEIKSYYYCRTNLTDLWKQNFRNGYWNIKTMNIAPGTLSIRHFVPFIFVLSLLTTWIYPVLWVFIVSCYLTANIYSSALLAIRNGLKYFFIMPFVFATLHFSYGFGSVGGIIRWGKHKTKETRFRIVEAEKIDIRQETTNLRHQTTDLRGEITENRRNISDRRQHLVDRRQYTGDRRRKIG